MGLTSLWRMVQIPRLSCLPGVDQPVEHGADTPAGPCLPGVEQPVEHGADTPAVLFTWG